MTYTRTAVFAIAAALIASGCAPGRLADLQDSGRISVGLSLGLSADAKLGDVLARLRGKED